MLTPRQQHCLRGIGVEIWRERATADVAEVDLTAPVEQQSLTHETPQPAPAAADAEQEKPAVAVRGYSDLPVDNWDSLEQSIHACGNCDLAAGCTQKVPGKGNRQAELMIIGEAPGRDEDLQGKPFVGRAGQLLDRMLEAIEIEPESVYITNILKCRPPNNRDPQADEISACGAFLRAQIALIEPRIIFSVGRISAQNLLQDSSPVRRLRGHLHSLPGTDIPLLVTYHPAYLLRNPREKARVWQDLKALRQQLGHAID